MLHTGSGGVQPMAWSEEWDAPIHRTFDAAQAHAAVHCGWDGVRRVCVPGLDSLGGQMPKGLRR